MKIFPMCGFCSYLFFILIWTFLVPNYHCWKASSTSSPRLFKYKVIKRNPFLISNKLRNGLKYLILPNKAPSNGLSAYLEILSGSVNERESERGMAHFLEHIAYMSAPSRIQLAGIAGSRANAFTDFHHTVYFSSCPTTANGVCDTRPTVLNMLSEVLQTPVDKERIAAERAAILSEMAHVNTVKHRIGMQKLHDLHADNILCSRDPIGREDAIRSWCESDIRRFQQRVYRPDNAVLYVVGDIDVPSTEHLIETTFGDIPNPHNSGLGSCML